MDDARKTSLSTDSITHDDALVSNVKEWLRKEGYPLEFRAVNIFEKLGLKFSKDIMCRVWTKTLYVKLIFWRV
jgi:hypothetical protein